MDLLVGIFIEPFSIIDESKLKHCKNSNHQQYVPLPQTLCNDHKNLVITAVDAANKLLAELKHKIQTRAPIK